MKILYFAWLRSKIGHMEETVPVSETVYDVDTLIAHLIAKGTDYQSVFNDMDVIRTAVNQEYITDNISLSDEDEVAFFPPVTGG